MKKNFTLLSGSVLFLTGMLVPISPLRAAFSYTSSGRPCTIVGTSRNDTLNGTSGDDVICGLGGNDTINGKDGNDTIDGGIGTDTISGGTGNDALTGGIGNDTMNGSDGTDTISGGTGNDALTGGAGNDTMNGDDGTDTISGGTGNDALTGGIGNDTMNGDDGSDEIRAGKGNDSLVGGPGDDLMLGEKGTDTMNGGDGSNRCDRDSGELAVRSCLYDTQAPQAISMTLSKTSVNTEEDSATIDVEVQITDDLVGPAGNGYSGSASQLLFTHPSGQSIYAGFLSSNRISGTKTKGTYRYTMTIPRGAAQGTWTATNFFLVDQVGNMRVLTTQQMNTAGFTTTFTQAGQGDSQAPQAISMTLSRTSLDTAGASATIDVEVQITDDLVGPSMGSQIRFMHSSGQSVDAIFSPEGRISGTATDGIYRYTMTIPRGAAQGTWTARYFLLADQVGNMRSLTTQQMNSAGFTTTFTQAGQGDTQAPQALSMTLSRTSIDTAGASATINVEVRITDDLVGTAGEGYSSSPSQIRFMHSSGQSVDAIFSPESRISGTATDGIYRYTMTIPRSAAQGTWTATYFLLADQIGNMRSLTTQQMNTAGFTTSFVNG